LIYLFIYLFIDVTLLSRLVRVNQSKSLAHNRK